MSDSFGYFHRVVFTNTSPLKRIHFEACGVIRLSHKYKDVFRADNQQKIRTFEKIGVNMKRRHQGYFDGGVDAFHFYSQRLCEPSYGKLTSTIV